MAQGSTQPLNRNEYQDFSWEGGKGRPARNADNPIAICEPSIWVMWEPGRLTTLWASTTCYRYSFTFIFTYLGFLCQSFRRLIHTHQSSRAGIVDSIVAGVASGLRPTPSQS
jgi:hypothetical protein